MSRHLVLTTGSLQLREIKVPDNIWLNMWVQVCPVMARFSVQMNFRK